MENQTNIFDLVEEVNRNKGRTSISKDKEMNDIFSMLDEVKKDNNISIDRVRSAVNSYSSSKQEDNSDSIRNNSNLVRKPVVPSNVTNWDKYSECIVAYLNSVDYGPDNSYEYVKGHNKALSKYKEELLNNHKDIYVVEGHVNDELNSSLSKASIEDKGYYDGLFYVLKSIKKAKEDTNNKVVNKLKEKLF